MIGRTLIAQPRVRLVRDLLDEPGGKARFANARLAGNQHDLALSCPGPALSLEQIGALVLAPDEPGEPRGMRRFEPALALRNPDRRPGFDRFGEALDGVLSEIAKAEHVAEQPTRRRRQDDAPGLGETLQPRGQIGRVADHGLFLRRPLADDVADDDEARGDADARGELFPRAGLESCNDFGDFEPRVHRPRGVVLVRAREAEVGQNAVAHEFGDEAVIARDDARDRVLIGANDQTHVLRIESRRKRG
jgi:hypothetical protein